MPKMRLGWYAGVSTALAGGVIISAFQQRANFYSAMVYLAQSNFCLLALVNFTLLLYSSFVYGLTRLCYGTLRAVEVEQLTERAWFAITETCLAMTIFREEIGAWFLVMFTALVTGKVWGWIGDGRVEFLEQQPPPNPRLFHIRLSISLTMSFLYDVWILRYTVNSVIQQARPNMMVMFLFEFAVLATCSWRTGARYILALTEQNIIQAQTRKRLLERRQEVREQREAMIRQREQAAAAGEEGPANPEPLPSEDDVDEMDIEVPGWAAKGEWVLWLDLLSDMIKLGIYVAFFFMLLMFYGLPIHIMRDLFMTSRDFVKRLHALLRYRRAIQEMNRYPDATAEELAQENTCIICREEMRPWDPANNPGAIDRVRPKKLPCSHILHLGCLKSWLERQQVCPTCRSPVTADRARGAQNRAAGLRIQIGGPPQARGQQLPAGDEDEEGAQGRQNDGQPQQPREGGPRVFNLGPIRLGFGANGQQVRELAQQFGIPQIAGNPPAAAPIPTPTQTQPTLGDNLQSIGNLLQQSEGIVQREMQRLQVAQQELQVAHLLMAELQRLQQRRQQPQYQPQNGHFQPPGLAPNMPMNPHFPMHSQFPHGQLFQMPAQAQFAGLPTFPGIPPRTGSPLMARLGAPANSAAIPAGSPDLPEGVTLPPGWSLMPLQRLDGAPNPSPPPPQSGGTPLNGDITGTNRVIMDSNTHEANGIGSAEAQTEGAAPPAVSTGEIFTGRPAETTDHSSRAAEPTPVVAPSPLMPNWGGSAQLFNTAPRVEPRDNGRSHPQSVEEQNGAHEQRAAPPREAGEASTGREQQAAEDKNADDEGGDPSSDKGKGKAATIEEANDDGD